MGEHALTCSSARKAASGVDVSTADVSVALQRLLIEGVLKLRADGGRKLRLDELCLERHLRLLDTCALENADDSANDDSSGASELRFLSERCLERDMGCPIFLFFFGFTALITEACFFNDRSARFFFGLSVIPVDERLTIEACFFIDLLARFLTGLRFRRVVKENCFASR